MAERRVAGRRTNTPLAWTTFVDASISDLFFFNFALFSRSCLFICFNEDLLLRLRLQLCLLARSLIDPRRRDVKLFKLPCVSIDIPLKVVLFFSRPLPSVNCGTT